MNHENIYFPVYYSFARTTLKPICPYFLIMSSANKDEARKEVNEAIINTSSSDINRMLDAAKSSREKREQSKREREAREAAIRERENTVSERIFSHENQY